MCQKKHNKVALITGSAGFIGFHVSKRLLNEGWKVIGLDSMSNYYDVRLKKCREDILLKNSGYSSFHDKVETPGVLQNLFKMEKPDIVIHLAAQAGVRHSIENPRSYLESNIIGTFELLEAAREYPPKHILIASTSSAYGASTVMPCKETAKADHQMSFYAATKKSTENIAHSYAHLFDLPITMFRFFTVYGPWGRPDMALFKFTKSMLNGDKIDVYNYGKMSRDFTYIDDLVEGIFRLTSCIPKLCVKNNIDNDSISEIAPFRVVNIGNSDPIPLLEFIKAIEVHTEHTADMNLLPMQPGDVGATYAENELLFNLTNFRPSTSVDRGVRLFVKWYRNFYNV
jgi:UDP-glucuronate 4-epimerase